MGLMILQRGYEKVTSQQLSIDSEGDTEPKRDSGMGLVILQRGYEKVTSQQLSIDSAGDTEPKRGFCLGICNDVEIL